MTQHTAQEAAIARIRFLVDADTLAKADRVAKINGRYIGLRRDNELVDGLKNSIASIAVTDLDTSAKPDKRRILALIGESGAGKTTALFEHTRSLEAMQPYPDEDGNQVTPLLAFTPPSPCPPLRLALEGLQVLRYPVKEDIKEHQAWAAFRRALKAHRVHWILIDEAQHTIDTANAKEMVKIANTFKELVQMPDWPVRLILSGVEPLGLFLSIKQLGNRKSVVHFEKVRGKSGDQTIISVLSMIVREHASLDTTLHKDSEFVTRLAHAADRDFGTIVQTVRSAVELAIMADDKVVTLNHFERAYASFSGCQKTENVFTAKNYVDLQPYRASVRDADLRWEEAQSKRRKSPLPAAR